MFKKNGLFFTDFEYFAQMPDFAECSDQRNVSTELSICFFWCQCFGFWPANTYFLSAPEYQFYQPRSGMVRKWVLLGISKECFVYLGLTPTSHPPKKFSTNQLLKSLLGMAWKYSQCLTYWFVFLLFHGGSELSLRIV